MHYTSVHFVKSVKPVHKSERDCLHAIVHNVMLGAGVIMKCAHGNKCAIQLFRETAASKAPSHTQASFLPTRPGEQEYKLCTNSMPLCQDTFNLRQNLTSTM